MVARGSIKEGFFPQRARKGAAVLTARTPSGMTCSFFVVGDKTRGLRSFVADSSG